MTTIRGAYDRINLTAQSREILRVILNIANGYEPNETEFIPDRFKVYKDIQ